MYLFIGLLFALAFGVVATARAVNDDLSDKEAALAVGLFFVVLLAWPVVYVGGLAYAVYRLVSGKSAL